MTVPLPQLTLELVIIIAVWVIFAFAITPRIIAYFLATRDLTKSALAEKLADFFAERALKKLEITPETIIPKMMEWAADPENRPVLNKVVANVLQTEAVGMATEQLFLMAKERIKAMFEGQLGADRKEIISNFREAIPEQAQAILNHPAVDTFLHALQVAGQLAAVVGKKPRQ